MQSSHQKLAKMLGIGPASRQTLDVPDRGGVDGLTPFQHQNISDLAEQCFGEPIDWTDADWEFGFTDDEMRQIEEWRLGSDPRRHLS